MSDTAATSGPTSGRALVSQRSPNAIAAFAAQQWARRSVPWLGALFIAAIVALAGFDIVRSYQSTVDSISRELDTQARILAEQTARSLQAVDVVLRIVAQEHRNGKLAGLDERGLHEYLRGQAAGLIQTEGPAEGLALYDAKGAPRALSWIHPMPDTLSNFADTPIFRALRDDPKAGLFIGDAFRSHLDGRWIFPIGRRVENSRGEFAGGIGARGRVEYFQQFYRAVHLNTDTTITLMHRRGTLLARHPAADAALGQHFPQFEQVLAARNAAPDKPMRVMSPVDGNERFGAVQSVPGYALEVVVTRDVAAALAPWRAQAVGTAVRTLALSVMAALLLWVLMRQLLRVSAARDSLAAIQERFALAVAGSDDGIWDWDHRVKRVFASARARELLGLAPGPEMQSMDEWFAALRFHPDDAPRRIEAMEAHLAGKSPAYEGEFRVQHPDGSYRWVRIRGLCVRDAGGEPLRMAGSVSDIDARKRAEEALRQSEERYALAVAGSNDGILDWDIVADHLFVSQRALQILGLEVEPRIRSRNEWTALMLPRFHPDDVPRVQQDLRHRPDVHESEYRVLVGDGRYRWVRFRGRIVRDAKGRAIRWAGSVSDVDAQKRTEEALRHSEQRYQLAAAGANQGLWDWDLVTDTMFVSARAQELLGLASADPLRPRREWVARFDYHPEDRERVRKTLAAYLGGTLGHWEVEYRIRNGESWHWYHDRGVALRDDSGRPYRMAGSLEDITDRKNAQAERELLEAQLRQAQKLEAMGTLAGGVAHDFNNILAAILGYGEMAQKDAAEGTQLRRHIDAALSAGLRAKALVERILAFSRSGMSERVPVHVCSVVSEVLDLVAGSLPHGVRLERNIAGGNAAVLGDPTQLHQVVMNLCANAVQAIKGEGKVTVGIETITLAEQRIATTSVLPAGNYVRLTVADTGSGIPPHVIERIFDPFFTTKQVGVGTGLGLSLVHGIVTDLDGGIDVESRPGAGATFTVYLPWQGSVAAPQQEDEPPVPGSGETILIVDDETALVRLGEEMMAELGYEPVGFASSLDALANFQAEPHRFDAVLSDEAMPGMTGSELAQEIRKIRPDIPIVLMSGYVTPALSARARDVGINEVLIKPLVSRDIARSLAAALRTPDKRSAIPESQPS
ncbi:MAG TPA: PAS domain-containing protein [Burkholderiaceae bacterium]|nr:PAS domain-containing protein [Burkholderiaceae bacterium]